MEPNSSMSDRDRGEIPLGPPPSRDRDGLSALERKALYRVHTELPAMPASLVVQILLWPEKITDWARDESVTPALVYNMLGGFKPYHSLRERLARRLGVTKGAVDHLIDARRQQPSTRRIPEPPGDFTVDDVALVSHLGGSPLADYAPAFATEGETARGETPPGNAADPAAGSGHSAERGVPGDSPDPDEPAGPQIALDF